MNLQVNINSFCLKAKQKEKIDKFYIIWQNQCSQAREVKTRNCAFRTDFAQSRAPGPGRAGATIEG